MDFLDKQIAPPKSWEKFEEISRSLFASIWDDPLAQKNGRAGQNQSGVDIYLNPSGDAARVFGIQCKGKDALYGSKATATEFDTELAKAECFDPPLSKWIFVTTAPNDAELQRHVRNVSQSRMREGKFPVHVIGWETFHALLDLNRSVVNQFYTEYVNDSHDRMELFKAAGQAAIRSIDDYLVHGGISLCLTREGTWSEARSTLSNGSILRLTGEGGTGKSAMLRRLGLDFKGELLVLKDSHVVAKTWQAFTASIAVTETASSVVARLSGSGPCMLLIDGADRLLLSDRRSVVTEILTAIAESPFLENWKIVTSARNYQGQDVVLAALNEAGFINFGSQVIVPKLIKEEALALGLAFPSFAEMLRREDLADQNRTLFLLRELFQRDSAPTGSFTEMDLAGAWATRVGTDPTASANRSQALSELGALLIREPGQRPGRAEVNAIGLQSLIDEGSVVVDARRDAISLSFDVHEDWLIARCLEREYENIPAILAASGEPLWWMRALRLTGQLLLESRAYDKWVSLIALLEAADGLDPAWVRSLLVAPLYSEKSTAILNDLRSAFLADDARLLAQLLETLQVFESKINESLLYSPVLAGMGEMERYRLMALMKQPQLASWVPFMKWSLKDWENWPSRLIPKLSQIAVQWARVTQHIENAYSQRIATICYRWLIEIEDSRYVARWDERHEPFGNSLVNYRDWENVEDRLREALTLSVKSAKIVLDSYLSRLAENNKLRSPREKILESPHQVPSYSPSKWVDMCLQQFVPARKRFRGRGGSIFPDTLFSWHEYNDAGIRGNTKFFPSSPIRAGFSQLFDTDEAEAIRLFHRLEMRASVFWRWYSRCEDRKEPKPLILHMPWGDFPLWGDATVYRWASGVLGSHVLGSAYLALDDWLHKQIANGRPPEELLLLVLQRHGLVTTASPCIAMLHSQINTPGAIDCAAPFLAEPRLWNYDIRRHLDRRDKAYRIGFMGRDDVHSDAVEKYHIRHAAYQPLSHAFLLPFRFKASETAQRLLDERRGQWKADDLVEFLEERNSSTTMAEYQDRIDRCISDSDPRQIEVANSEDNNQIIVSIKPPENALPEIAQLEEDRQRLSKASRLFGWVDGTRKRGALDQAMALEDAIALAKELLADLQNSNGSLLGSLGSIRNAAIVGAAAVAAHHGSEKFVHSHREWIEQLLLSGARTQRSQEELQYLVDQSILSFDAQEYAAWGLPALASRQPFSTEIDQVVLALAVQRLNAIASAVMEGLRWDRRAEFAWTVTIAALDCCVVDIGHHWRSDNEKRKAALRMVSRRKLAIERGIKNQNLSRMPSVPPEPYILKWIFTKKWRRPFARLKIRSRTGFDWNKAKEIMDRMRWSEVASSPQRRGHFSQYLERLVNWTKSYSEDDQERYDSHFPYEWGHALAKYIGQFSAATGSGSEWKALLAFTYRDRAEDLVADYLDAVATELVVSEREPDERFWAAWKPAANWVMQNAVPKRRPSWDNTPHALQAAGFVGPYSTPIPPNWPHLAELLPRIDEWQQATKHLPGAAHFLLAIVERMSAAQRQQWYVSWLERLVDENGSDETFWDYGGLGDKAAALVKILTAEKDVDVVSLRRCLAAIADSGSAVARELIPRFSKSRPK